jgi:UDP-glucuronate decarboxylase
LAGPDDFGCPINICNPNEFTMLELAETVIALTGSRSEIVHAPLPSDDPSRRCPDIRLAKAVLGWQPQVQLREGLTATIAYFDELLSRRRSKASEPRDLKLRSQV